MTKTLAAAKKSVVFASAAAALSISSILLPATAAHALPKCSPFNIDCQPTSCQFQPQFCEEPPVVQDPPKPPKGPNICQRIDCDNLPEVVIDPEPEPTSDPEPEPEPTQPPAQPENDTPTTDPTPNDGNPATDDSPKTTGGSRGTGRTSSAQVSDQTVAGSEDQPVQVSEEVQQAASTSESGIPTIVWVLLSAALTAAAVLGISKVKKSKAEQI